MIRFWSSRIIICLLVNIGDDKMLSQVTDKVLEKLIEDEDFVAGR